MKRRSTNDFRGLHFSGSEVYKSACLGDTEALSSKSVQYLSNHFQLSDTNFFHNLIMQIFDLKRYPEVLLFGTTLKRKINKEYGTVYCV